MNRPIVQLLLLFLLVPPPCWSAAAEDPVPEPSRAEIEPLRQVVREQRIETTAARPGVALYLRDLTVAVSEGIVALLAWLFPDVGSLTRRIARVGAQVVIGVAVLLLGLFLLRLAVRRWWRRPEKPASPVRVLPQPERSDARSPERWEAELGRHLARGDVAAALEALWWWLACGLLPRDVDPSWTTRELISRAGRWDLAAWVRRLDRMIYGAETPAVDEVRRLWGDLREVLG